MVSFISIIFLLKVWQETTLFVRISRFDTCWKKGAIHMKNWLDLGHWDIFHGFLIASFDCFGSGFINSLMGWSFLSDLKSTMLRSFEEQWTRSRIGACHWLLLAHSCENWKLVSGHPDITNPNESRKLFSWMRWFFSLLRRSTSYVSVVVATHKPPQIQKDALPIRKDQLVSWHGPFSID